nr:MAG TPA: hypothetical protein [Caudoviricetes sp.]
MRRFFLTHPQPSSLDYVIIIACFMRLVKRNFKISGNYFVKFSEILSSNYLYYTIFSEKVKKNF